MAKKSKVEANKKKAIMIARHLEKRRQLRAIFKDMKRPESERLEAYRKLQALPRNSAENRYRNRCELSGRPRGFLGKFKLSRIKFRELALRGLIPGVTKSSW